MNATEIPPVITTDLTDEDVDRIENLVREYKLHKEQAAERLLENIHVWSLVIRMARVMAANIRYSGSDPLVYNWVVTWATEEELSVLRDKNSTAAARAGQEIMTRASKLLKTLWDEQDFIQEAQLTVLELADRYQEQGSSFWNYLLSTLPYYVRHRANRMISDACTYKDHDASQAEVSFKTHETIEPLDDDQYSDLLDVLTETEKTILYSMIIEGVPYDELAKKLNIPVSTLYWRRKRAIEKIEEAARQRKLLHKG